MATLVSRYRFENSYNDTTSTNNLSAQGSGNVFAQSPAAEGTYSLSTNGSGAAAITSGATGWTTGNADWSWGGWMLTSTWAANQDFMYWGTRSSGQSWECYQVTDTSTMRITLDSLENGDFTLGTINDGAWHWIWFEYTASTKTIQSYFDNVAKTSKAYANTPNIQANIIGIGQTFDGTRRSTSNWDDFRIYNGVTSSSERTAIYYAGNKFNNGMLEMFRP